MHILGRNSKDPWSPFSTKSCTVEGHLGQKFKRPMELIFLKRRHRRGRTSVTSDPQLRSSPRGSLGPLQECLVLQCATCLHPLHPPPLPELSWQSRLHGGMSLCQSCSVSPGEASKVCGSTPRAPTPAAAAGLGRAMRSFPGRAQYGLRASMAGWAGLRGGPRARAGFLDGGREPPPVLDSVGSGQVGKPPGRGRTEQKEVKAGCAGVCTGGAVWAGGPGPGGHMHRSGAVRGPHHPRTQGEPESPLSGLRPPT